MKILSFIGYVIGFSAIIAASRMQVNFVDPEQTYIGTVDRIDSSMYYEEDTEELEPIKVDEQELNVLSMACYAETRGESKTGKVFATQVSINRVKDDRFPDTVHEVIHEINGNNVVQYSWKKVQPEPKNSIDKKAYEECRSIAITFLSIDIKIHDGLYFHNHTVTGKTLAWFKTKKEIRKIGNHIFYGEHG